MRVRFTRRRLQVAAYFFVVLMAMVAVAGYESIQNDKLETRVIERLEPQITRLNKIVTPVVKTIDTKSGRAGVDGNNGARGNDGINGIQGLRGPAGPKGEKGDKGEQGPKGEPGNDGTNGQSPTTAALEQQVQALQVTVNGLQMTLAQVRGLVCGLVPSC